MKHRSMITALSCLLLGVSVAAGAADIQWLSVDYSFQANWTETFILINPDTGTTTWSTTGCYSGGSHNDVPFVASLVGPAGTFDVSTRMNRVADSVFLTNDADANVWWAPRPTPSDPDGYLIANGSVTSTAVASWRFQPLHSQLMMDLVTEQYFNYSPNEQSFNIALKDLTAATTLFALDVLGSDFDQTQTHYGFAVDSDHEYELITSTWISAWDAKLVYQSFEATLVSVPEPSTGVLAGSSLLIGLILVIPASIQRRKDPEAHRGESPSWKGSSSRL